jgi:hypothetical protein
MHQLDLSGQLDLLHLMHPLDLLGQLHLMHPLDLYSQSGLVVQ